MSVDGTKLLFESFLKKRKDTLKIMWVTYWFRLQNTTLFYYTKKNGSASHLRGHYYIYTVQSVREVQKSSRRHFMFEIVMTNGKRKMLAAETAALRKEWVTHLWQAMHLSGSGMLDSGDTHPDECEQQENLDNSKPVGSDTDDVMEPSQPLPAHTHSHQTCPEASGTASLICPPEETTYPTLLLPFNDQILSDEPNCDARWSGGMSGAEETQEGVYDILPRRSFTQEYNDPPTEALEDVYDFPISYRTSIGQQDPTDSIYDTPSCLLRKTCDLTTGEELEEGIYDIVRSVL